MSSKQYFIPSTENNIIQIKWLPKAESKVENGWDNIFDEITQSYITSKSKLSSVAFFEEYLNENYHTPKHK